jgi:hypothetical protein
MSQNQEIIESKLCAYVDGELDPEGRAEIEKHLDANPQHRRLLESLRATRDLLRWLPREQAPPELAETLNGQLERSVLLDYEGDGLKVAVWPRVFAAAAIIILTAGLGAAVFYALPRSQKPALARGDSGSVSSPADGGQNLERPFAFSATAPSDAGIDAPRTAGSEPVGGTERAKGKDDESRKELASAKDVAGELHKGGFTALDFMDRAKKADEPSPAPAGLAGGRKLELSDLDELAQQVTQNPDVFAAAPTVANNTSTQPGSTSTNNAMVMLVRSDAPEQTEKQLTSYFKTQQIQWRQTQLPAQQLGLNGQKFGSQNQLASAALGNSQTVLAPDGREEKQQSAVLRDASQKPMGDISVGKAGKTADLKGDQLRENLSSGLNHAIETRPTGSDALPPRPEAPVAAAQNRVEIETVNAAPAQQQGRFIENGSNAYRSNGVYVVQMSRRQAAQLCTTISNDPSQAALTKDLNGLSYSNSNSDVLNSHNMPAAEQQLGDNGRNVYGLKSSSPATNPALQQAFREQRKVAAGSSDADLDWKRSIEARGARDKPPTTRPAEVATLAKPVAGESADKAFPAPTPSRHFIDGTNVPATQPTDPTAAPTTAPSDEPLSVVILVEANGSPAALPAAALAPVPSTQPIGQIEQLQSPAASQPAQNAK